MACSIQHLKQAVRDPRSPDPASYPPISSIPQTSAARLRAALEPLADDDKSTLAPAPAASTVLYLAYGSNLAAATFLGARGIRPLSQINVAAPTFNLVFDLPGFPYAEPCFANIAPRKIPKPALPDPGDPTKPPIKLPPPSYSSVTGLPTLPDPPGWGRGLIGVVYEVTQADFTHIIATEGGGANYQTIPCPVLPLPAPVHVPERPPVPELPRPFIAYTLFVPQLPGNAPPPPAPSPPPPSKWWLKLALPIRRSPPDYAQPSLRYLSLIRDGAREHFLPDDYVAWLDDMEPYTITTRGQKVGRWLFAGLLLPIMLVLLPILHLFNDEDGRSPSWVNFALAAFFNLVWMTYDGVLKKVLGDGERTIHDDDHDDADGDRDAKVECGGGKGWTVSDGAIDEKRGLVSQ